MSWITKLIGGSIAEPITAVGNIIDSLYTSDGELLDKKTALLRVEQQPALIQSEVNKIEAQHRSVFVAGWRPFIGWVCGFALAWHFMLYDMALWVQINFFPATTQVPALTGTEGLMTVLLSLLGLGGMRTFEKMKGKTK